MAPTIRTVACIWYLINPKKCETDIIILFFLKDEKTEAVRVNKLVSYTAGNQIKIYLILMPILYYNEFPKCSDHLLIPHL